jgi:hypothetical protein
VTCGRRTARREAVAIDEVVRVVETLVLAALLTCGTDESP